MAAISVRDLDDDVAARLKVRAAQHGRSMEAEVRAILTETVSVAEEKRINLAQAIREHFGAIPRVELEIPPRSEMPRAAGLPDLP
jgi:plasmid stability protein